MEEAFPSVIGGAEQSWDDIKLRDGVGGGGSRFHLAPLTDEEERFVEEKLMEGERRMDGGGVGVDEANASVSTAVGRLCDAWLEKRAHLFFFWGKKKGPFGRMWDAVASAFTAVRRGVLAEETETMLQGSLLLLLLVVWRKKKKKKKTPLILIY